MRRKDYIPHDHQARGSQREAVGDLRYLCDLVMKLVSSSIFAEVE